MKILVLNTIIALYLVGYITAQVGLTHQPNAVQPNFGADPSRDTTPVYIASQIQVYANQLLKQEQSFLAKQDDSKVDFNVWYQGVLNKFELQQERQDYRTNTDRDRDLNSFKRQLLALQAEFTENTNEKQYSFDTRIISKYWSSFTSKYLQASKYIIQAGNEYNTIKRQQLGIYADLIEISGAGYYPATKTTYLVNIGGSNGYGGLNPFNPVPVFVPVTNWNIRSNPQIGPLGPYSNGSPTYPDPGSKLGILYDKIVVAFDDYTGSSSSKSKQIAKRDLAGYQQEWVSLSEKWLNYRKQADRLEQKLRALNQRIEDYITIIANIITANALPSSIWGTTDQVAAAPDYDNVYG